MMSGHGANPIFFNKKNKDWTSRTLANPHPPTFDDISFLPYLSSTPLKVDVICVSPLIVKVTVKLSQNNPHYLKIIA